MQNQDVTKEMASQADVLKAYQSIFESLYQKESETVTDKNKYSPLEALQEVMERYIAGGIDIEKGKEYAYLKQGIKFRLWDKYESEYKHNIFKGLGEKADDNFGILAEIEAEKGYGISRAHILDMLRDIRKTLTIEEHFIWYEYSINDRTAKDIGKDIQETEVSVCRKLKRIFNKIQKLNYRDLVDIRYVNAEHPKRRSYYRPYEEENGKPQGISREAYESTVKTPVIARKHYKTGALSTVFLKETKRTYKYCGEIVEGNKNKELAQILKTWAQAWKEETNGIQARKEMDYQGPADCLMTYRVGGALMVNTDSPRLPLRISK